jgi:hypothetical protein
MRTIEVTVGPKGEVQLETRGFAGRACQDVAQTLVGCLGQPVAEQLTAEFYRSETACAQTNAAASLETPRP